MQKNMVMGAINSLMCFVMVYWFAEDMAAGRRGAATIAGILAIANAICAVVLLSTLHLSLET